LQTRSFNFVCQLGGGGRLVSLFSVAVT